MRILLLSTWFPYPLSQGSKIRAYYLLKALAEQHEVALVSFADTEIEPDWIEHVRQFCSRIEVVPQNPFSYPRWRSLLGWLSPQPSAVSASYSEEMSGRVAAITREWKPACVVALTFVTAPYVLPLAGVRKVVDVDNLMSPMLYEAYRHAPGWTDSARRWLAWKKFAEYERWLYRQFDRLIVVSPQDRQAITGHCGVEPERVWVAPNGVDTTLNHPGLGLPQPDTLVFNGSLNYNLNLDGIQWFLEQIFPQILEQAPAVRLKITGKTSPGIVEMISRYARVELTGYLEDVRPAVADSWVCVAPLRFGGGSRLKILEAMALGTPVISTPKGAEGLELNDGEHLLIAGSPREFAAQTLRLLSDPELHRKISTQAAEWVARQYDWQLIGQDLRVELNRLIPGDAETGARQLALG